VKYNGEEQGDAVLPPRPCGRRHRTFAVKGTLERLIQVILGDCPPRAAFLQGIIPEFPQEDPRLPAFWIRRCGREQKITRSSGVRNPGDRRDGQGRNGLPGK